MKIGFDITTLSMPKTGIGQYQYNLLEALFEIDKKNSYNLYAFNLRDNQKYNQLDFRKKKCKCRDECLQNPTTINYSLVDDGKMATTREYH